MPDTKVAKLIHVARILEKGKGKVYLFLRRVDTNRYVWFKEESQNNEIDTGVEGETLEDALYQARKHWQLDSFSTLHCGFRYSLPDRDEHGQNALFYQMGASYNSMNGIYFDEDLGHNCIVSFASVEARDLWNRLQQAALV